VKKNILILLCLLFSTLFLCNSCSETTRQYRDAHINYDSLALLVPKSDTLTFLNKELGDTNTEFRYLISTNYPELIHFEKELVQRKINNKIESTLSEIIELFRIDQEFMFNDTTGVNLPDSLDEFVTGQSILFINYTILNNSRNLFSMIFQIEQYNALAAHPISYHKTLNFDMSNGEIIELQDFIPTADSNFIETIADISFELINSMDISDSIWIRNGILPEWENFRNYNITTDSLILTFDVYQVAPYSVGPVRVPIAWSDLKSRNESKNMPDSFDN
jgi:hypothetical protein